MTRIGYALAIALTGALLLSACGGIANPSNNTTMLLNPTTVGGSQTVVEAMPVFSVHQLGVFSMAVTAVAPDTSVYVGIALASNAGGGCSIGTALDTNPLAGVGLPGLSTTIQVGDYCVIVFDPYAEGAFSTPLPRPETVTISINYP